LTIVDCRLSIEESARRLKRPTFANTANVGHPPAEIDFRYKAPKIEDGERIQLALKAVEGK
jgi:hypothetical protein